jgi:hypothetical protein
MFRQDVFAFNMDSESGYPLNMALERGTMSGEKGRKKWPAGV